MTIAIDMATVSGGLAMRGGVAGGGSAVFAVHGGVAQGRGLDR